MTLEEPNVRRGKTRENLTWGAAVSWIVLATLGLPACEPEDEWSPPEAPPELAEVTALVFANFDTTEPGVLEEHVGTLRTHLLELDLTGEYEQRSYTPANLTQEAIDTVTNPGRDPADTLPVALVTASSFPPEDHVNVIVMPSQTIVEPASPDQYDREFLDPTNPDCFPGRDCLRLDTMNTILKDYLLLELLYEMPKSYRWVEIGESGSGEWGIVGRAWLEQEWWDPDGALALLQSYSLDLFVPVDGGGIRYMSLWPETYIEGLDDTDDFILSTTAEGMNDMFVATEEYVAEHF